MDVTGPIMQAEESILCATNEVGIVATEEALKQYDADGAPIMMGGVKWYAMAPKSKYYQTPYGEAVVRRHVYEQACGGKTFCPLEHGARILRNATPRFAQLVAHKLAQGAAGDVMRDLVDNHGRPTSKLLVQELGAYVGAVVQAKEETWHYATPKLDEEVATIVIGVDGACMLLCEQGWREAMAGSISLYGRSGKRLHTIYVAAAPQHGRAMFWTRMEREIAHVKRHYPHARLIGLADGAQSNWDFLTLHVDEQIVDFYHATEYLARTAEAMFATDLPRQRIWLETQSARLADDWDGAALILEEWTAFDCHGWSKERKKALDDGIRYFRNHLHQMHYKRYRDRGMPIGSGVTEADCKTLVKQRLCRSGMRWSELGAQAILSLRALLLTETRWAQFWQKIEQFGAPAIEFY